MTVKRNVRLRRAMEVYRKMTVKRNVRVRRAMEVYRNMTANRNIRVNRIIGGLALFWDVTQRRMLVCYRRFETT